MEAFIAGTALAMVVTAAVMLFGVAVVAWLLRLQRKPADQQWPPHLSK